MATAGGPHPILAWVRETAAPVKAGLRAAAAAAKGLNRDGVLEPSAANG
jgi:hypothetical protein